jgi:hypothetical protein
MNCVQHADRPAAAYCRTCGKALCESCQREIRKVVYCEDCLANRVQAATPPAANVPPYPGRGPHPVIAGLLAGFLPFGVGPVYNGLYSRGLLYLAIFIGLTWGCNQGGIVGGGFGIALAAFIVFQIIDTVRSAHYLRMGMPAPDPFGMDRLFGGMAAPPSPAAPVPPGVWPSAVPPAGVSMPPPTPVPAAGCERSGSSSSVPLYAVLLIGLGILFLLCNLGLTSMHWVHMVWPVTLIVIGGWLLHARWGEVTSCAPGRQHRVMGPAVLLALGVGFLVSRLLGVSIWMPLLLIVMGAVLVWQRTLPPYPPPAPSSGVAPPAENNMDRNRER